MMKIIAILLSLLLLSIVYPNTVSESTSNNIFYVDDDNIEGPWDGTQEHPYQYIQDAIDNSDDGDTIFVYSGIYYESLFIDKSIDVIGENKNSTIIDGNRNSKIVWINHSEVRLCSFTLRNSDPSGFAQAVYIWDYTFDTWFNNISFSDCIITDCAKGIYARNVAHVSIKNCTIVDNLDEGINIQKTNNLIITNCTFKNNGNLGGIDIVGGGSNVYYSNIIISYCHISENDGRGIHIAGDAGFQCEIFYNEIHSNTGTGIDIAGTVEFNIHDNNIYENGDGGIELRLNPKGALYNNLIVHNQGSVPHTANGIYVRDCTNYIDINNNSIYSNTGSGILIEVSSGINIYNNKLFKNTHGVYLSNSDQNFVCNNNIENSSFFGLWIVVSSFNEFKYNNFVSNKDNVYLANSWKNVWSNNYWDDWKGYGPYIIFGKIFIFFPWLNFDWHPAREPNDI